MKTQRNWMLCAIPVLLLALFCLTGNASANSQLIDKCISYGLFNKQLCVQINETDCTSLSVNVLNQGSTLFSGSKDISSAIGIEGETELFCGTAIRDCDTCLILKSPKVNADGELDYCFEITTSCSGFDIFDYNFDCVSSGLCAFGCPAGCSGHGNCVNGACQCDTNYGGLDCSIPVQNQCVTIESNGKKLCTSTTVDCDQVVVDVTVGGEKVGTWITDVDGLKEDKEFTICSIGATPGCDVCLHMEDVEITSTNFHGCLMAQFSCYDQVFDLGCQDRLFPADCDINCEFNYLDTVLRDLERPVELTINNGEWWYGYFPVIGDLADVSLEVNSTNPNAVLDAYMRENCRPSADAFTSKKTSISPAGSFSTWTVYDDCDASLQGSAEIFYFAIHCSSNNNSPCSFEIKANGHYVYEIPVREQSEAVWTKGDAYTYFYFVPTTYDPFHIQLDVATSYTTISSVELSYDLATCPTASHSVEVQTESFFSGLNFNIRTESFNVSVPYPIPGLVYFVKAKINAQCSGDWCAVSAASVVYPNDDSLPSYYYSSVFWYDWSTTTLTSLPDWYSYFSWWQSYLYSNTPDAETNSKTPAVETNSKTPGADSQPPVAHTSDDKTSNGLNESSDPEEDDNTTLIIILSITIPILVLVIVAVAGVAIFMFIKYQRARNEHYYSSAIDDDGLRLDDGDFEL
eukprot:TRINITY_DN5310_c0_g1_i1.p1 TRINITY_DN5310_c0_g1~~TRINITY_DN5310_c0_g1_i1.p1  ORF type:complete len:727 (+),score=308.41 TRINITY_DN5310_c0_g1_i1:120-2183(+)